MLTPVDCEPKRHYVCQTKSLDQEPDMDCPRDYYSYRSQCIKVVRDRLNFETAQEMCAQTGAVVNAPKDEGEFEFWRSLAKSESKMF